MIKAIKLFMREDQGQKQASTILVVEDDPAIGAFLIEAITQETPYQLVLVTDSHKALQLVPEVKPILFILNYQLPHMNGIELYDRLHSIEEVAHVPAIMVSAVLPKHLLAQRKIVGISKPFDLGILLDTIAQLTA